MKLEWQQVEDGIRTRYGRVSKRLIEARASLGERCCCEFCGDLILPHTQYCQNRGKLWCEVCKTEIERFCADPTVPGSASFRSSKVLPPGPCDLCGKELQRVRSWYATTE